MNRAASKPPIRYSPIGTPLSRIQTPMLPCQKPVHRSARESAIKLLFVISSIAPTDSGLEEAVDISVEHCGRITDLVLGAQVLYHLVRV